MPLQVSKREVGEGEEIGGRKGNAGRDYLLCTPLYKMSSRVEEWEDRWFEDSCLSNAPTDICLPT